MGVDIISMCNVRCLSNPAGNEEKKHNKPWISTSTLALLDDRAAARRRGDRGAEWLLHKQVRRSAKADMATSLNEKVADGSWQSIRGLAHPKGRKQGRLRKLDGELASSEFRAEIMATYLE